ncbi:neurexin 1-like isoform X2 [Lineus longissimus]|uniref:neurexin 1-like isoform X2 n=1 Tax=Lineus longissimus TaxID=88925 RepID=UPI00315D0562
MAFRVFQSAFYFVCGLILCVNGFELEGSQNSFAKFQKWNPCRNSTISLEFKTDEPNGLILYFDDGGHYDFFEIKLVGGVVRFRLNLGHGAIILAAGQNLNNNNWHKIEITLNGGKMTLQVDSLTHSKPTTGFDQNFGNITNNSDVFIGGLPEAYDNKLGQLALPSVVFEPHLRGSIRNLLYSNCSEAQIRPEMTGFKGLRFNTEVDACRESNPCLNSGICISTDNGALCDCSQTEYVGENCEKERKPSIATFYGTHYLSYDLSSKGDPILSNRDTIIIEFKTRQSSGLLFYTGDGGDYINIALKEGGVLLTTNLGSGPFTTSVMPDRLKRFDDNKWHKLIVKRESRELTRQHGFLDIRVSVDGIEKTGTTSGEYKMLSSNILYVAGSPDTGNLPGSRIRNNFKGCMKNVMYIADSIRLDITNLAVLEHELISIYGDVKFGICEDFIVSQPITFLTPNSYIRIPPWQAPQEGSIAFEFQTSEPDGLIMYNSGAESLSDFFAVELLQGRIFVILDLGSGFVKVKGSDKLLNDSIAHKVVIKHNGKDGTVAVDDETQTYKTRGKNEQLDLGGSLFVGGMNHRSEAYMTPYSVWTAMLKVGFVGCIHDLEVNSDKVDLALHAREQEIADIGEYCLAMDKQCSSRPCMNQGHCTEGWNRYICDCVGTGYNGIACNEVASTLSFDGTQYVLISVPDESQTEAEDISIRFKTKRPTGLIFATSTDQTLDRMELSIADGRLSLEVNLGSGAKTLAVGNNVNDNKWHTAEITRRARNIKLQLDKQLIRRAKLPKGKGIILRVAVIHVGSYVNVKKPRDDMTGEARLLEFKDIKVGKVNIKETDKAAADEGKEEPVKKAKYSPFLGYMQQFIFNGNHFFEMAKEGIYKNIEITAKFGETGKLVQMPVTFKSGDSYALLSPLNIYATFSIYFQFKTTDENGLMFYSAGKGYDFIAIEMVDSKVNYIFNTGSGTRLMVSNTKKPLNDNMWHDVAILRPNLQKQVLKVDGSAAKLTTQDDSNAVHFDLEGPLNVGGVEKSLYNSLPNLVVSKRGYQGCLGSLDFSGVTPNIMEDAQIPKEFRAEVIEGCNGPTTQCSPGACENGGNCVQQWNSFICDCDMTSYSGARCNEPSIAYRFEEGGLIEFSFPYGMQPDTKRDQLALGIVTTDTNAVLVRIDSGSSDDYIEMELVNGNILVVYNMGTTDHPIGELFHKVNDGKYHVIRFTREGPNATIQVDNLPVRRKNPTGRQLNIFNNQHKVYIGGKPARDRMGRRKKRLASPRVTQPFSGTIAGLVLNGRHILEVASMSPKDNRIAISPENVYLQVAGQWSTNVTPLTPTKPVIGTPVPGQTATTGMQSTMGIKEVPPPSSTEIETPSLAQTTPRQDGATDDIIFSGNGSGCRSDDEDDCPMGSSGDNIITPVIKIHTTPAPPTTTVPTTTSTTTLPTTTPGKIEGGSGMAPCDDDDTECDGSGDGEVIVDATPKSNNEDIYIHGKSTQSPSMERGTQDSLVITVNMTETPPRRNFDDSSKRPGQESHDSRGGNVTPINVVTPSVGANLNQESSGFNIASFFTLPVIIGIAVGGLLLLLIIIYIIYKCKGRDEGSYKIDESKNYRIESKPLKSDPHINGGLKAGVAPAKPHKKKDVKEWYV